MRRSDRVAAMELPLNLWDVFIGVCLGAQLLRLILESSGEIQDAGVGITTSGLSVVSMIIMMIRIASQKAISDLRWAEPQE